MKKTIFILSCILIGAVLVYVEINTKNAKETQRPLINPKEYLTMYTDNEFHFSFMYSDLVSLNNDCGFEQGSVTKQVAVHSNDEQDKHINPIMCLYVSKDKPKIDYATEEQITLAGKEVTRYNVSVAGSDEYFYLVPLSGGETLYIKTDKSYVTGKSVTFEDTAYFDHFLELSNALKGILDSLKVR